MIPQNLVRFKYFSHFSGVMQSRLGEFTCWARSCFRPDILNDYLRLSALSLSMGLLIGIASAIIHEIYINLAELTHYLTH